MIFEFIDEQAPPDVEERNREPYAFLGDRTDFVVLKDSVISLQICYYTTGKSRCSIQVYKVVMREKSHSVVGFRSVSKHRRRGIECYCEMEERKGSTKLELSK